MKIALISILISCPFLIFGRNSKTINLDLSIKPTQKLSLLNSKELNNLDVEHLKNGYIELENCIELEVKSNIPWVLIAYDDSFQEGSQNNFKIRVSSNPYVFLTHDEILFFQGNSVTSGEIINIDCKRLVNWDTTKPGQWEFSPLFKLLPLRENWIND